MEVETLPQEKRKREEEEDHLCIHCNKEARFAEDMSLFSDLVESHYFCSLACQSKYYAWELMRDGETQWVYNRRLYFMRLLAKNGKVIKHIKMVQMAIADVVEDVRKIVLFNIMDTMSLRYARAESGRLAAYHDHVLFIGMRDTLFVQGPNEFSQLGTGLSRQEHEKSVTPIPLRIPGVIFVATTHLYSSVITKNDDDTTSLWVTGRLVYLPAFEVYKFTRISGINDAIAVHCDKDHIVIVLKDNTFWSCPLTSLIPNGDELSAKFANHERIHSIISFSRGYHIRMIKNDGTVWSSPFNGGEDILSFEEFKEETGLYEEAICLSLWGISITLGNTLYMKKKDDNPLQSILGSPIAPDDDTDVLWFGDADYYLNMGLFLCVNHMNGVTSLRRHYMLQNAKVPFIDTVGNSDHIVSVVIGNDLHSPNIYVLKEDGSYWIAEYKHFQCTTPATLKRVDYLAPLIVTQSQLKKPRCKDCTSSAHFSALCMSTGNLVHHCESHY